MTRAIRNDKNDSDDYKYQGQKDYKADLNDGITGITRMTKTI